MQANNYLKLVGHLSVVSSILSLFGLLGKDDMSAHDAFSSFNLGFHLSDHGSLLLDQSHETLILTHTGTSDRTAHLSRRGDNGTLEDLVEIVNGLLRRNVSLDVKRSIGGSGSGGDEASVDGVENVVLNLDSLGESVDGANNGGVLLGQSGQLGDQLLDTRSRGGDDRRLRNSQSRKRSLDDSDLADVSVSNSSLMVDLVSDLTNNMNQMGDLLHDRGSLGGGERNELSSEDSDLSMDSLGLNNGGVNLVIGLDDALDQLRVSLSDSGGLHARLRRSAEDSVKSLAIVNLHGAESSTSVGRGTGL